nr:MAG TPA: hypothetical protein [Caudoviricetes sp.]
MDCFKSIKKRNWYTPRFSSKVYTAGNYFTV